mmetsp:Transcript_35494/g.72333  ORF Transcript_35494/g.72333 Transcript_35494/m.72333 type:complete len:211 (+) Transcript_35494:323-955(+)
MHVVHGVVLRFQRHAALVLREKGVHQGMLLLFRPLAHPGQESGVGPCARGGHEVLCVPRRVADEFVLALHLGPRAQAVVRVVERARHHLGGRAYDAHAAVPHREGPLKRLHGGAQAAVLVREVGVGELLWGHEALPDVRKRAVHRLAQPVRLAQELPLLVLREVHHDELPPRLEFRRAQRHDVPPVLPRLAFKRRAGFRVACARRVQGVG